MACLHPNFATGLGRQFIKGQKYTLLSNRANLTHHGRRSLAKLLEGNQRLNIAYLLKESFSQLWNYQSEVWARRFFEYWKQTLKWQRLKSSEEFSRMIDRHWDGIADYCDPRNKVPLGFVEGCNNKIRVLQLRVYGLRDEELSPPENPHLYAARTLRLQTKPGKRISNEPLTAGGRVL